MLKKLLFLLVLTPVAATGFDTAPDDPPIPPDFTFARLVYSGSDWRRSNAWHTDYPKADLQFLYALGKLTDFTFVNSTNRAIPILSEELFDYPFAYAVEVGYMQLSDEEAAQLREFLLRGGFLMVDDFHGTREWDNFYRQLKKILPEYEPEPLPVTHPIFHCYFDIDELFQVPGLQFVYSGRSWERDGYEARYLGVHDDQGRLMVFINHNVDLGDAWEWAERPDYPRPYAHLAFQLGVNAIIYSMTH